MVKEYKGLPLLDAALDEWTLGIYRLSLVDDPATEHEWMLFAKQGEKPIANMKFAITDADEHKVLSVIMLADTPIFRIDEQGNPFYIQFPKKVLYEAARRMLRDGYQRNVNIEHIDSSFVEGFDMVQLFVKDSAKGINPVGFEDVAEGSLFGEFFVNDETLWNEIKSGRFKGISLEGEFLAEQRETEINTVEDLLEQLGIA